MSKRSSKHAQTEEGGLAVMERPREKAIAQLAATAGATKAEVEKAVAEVSASAATVIAAAERMPKIVRQKKVAPALQQAQEDESEAERIKRLKAAKKQSAAAASARSKPQFPAVAVDGLIATCYQRKGASKLSGFGALVQIPAMAGSLKGRWCKHKHATADEAIACATADIKAIGPLTQSLRKATVEVAA